jgi:hypothetical protein
MRTCHNEPPTVRNGSFAVKPSHQKFSSFSILHPWWIRMKIWTFREWTLPLSRRACHVPIPLKIENRKKEVWQPLLFSVVPLVHQRAYHIIRYIHTVCISTVHDWCVGELLTGVLRREYHRESLWSSLAYTWTWRQSPVSYIGEPAFKGPLSEGTPPCPPHLLGNVLGNTSGTWPQETPHQQSFQYFF